MYTSHERATSTGSCRKLIRQRATCGFCTRHYYVVECFSEKHVLTEIRRRVWLFFNQKEHTWVKGFGEVLSGKGKKHISRGKSIDRNLHFLFSDEGRLRFGTATRLRLYFSILVLNMIKFARKKGITASSTNCWYTFSTENQISDV